MVAQVALSMTLLAAAGLFVKSFVRLQTVDPGYDFEQIALATIGLSPTCYASASTRAEFFRRLEQMLEEQPGIEAVTRMDRRGFRSGFDLQAEGGLAHPNQPYRVPSASVAPDYLHVMGVELLAGRAFETTDIDTDAVIIDLDLARFLWSDGVGRRFRLGAEGDWMTVIGVVKELRPRPVSRVVFRLATVGPAAKLGPTPIATSRPYSFTVSLASAERPTRS